MIGSIAGLRDATETRAITHIMTKAPDKDERGELEVEDFVEEKSYQQIRNNLYIFALRNWKKIESTYQNIEITNLKKRDAQLWKPILTIAKVINEDLFGRVLEFAIKVSEQRKQDFIPEGSFDYEILEILKNYLDSGEDLIYIKAISDKFNESKEKKIAPKTISGHLDKLGFKEYREKNMHGSHLKISKEIFDIIISPLIPDFSSYSSYSSDNKEKDTKLDDECMTNYDEQKKTPMTNMTNYDEYDEYSKQENKSDDEKIDKILEEFS
jgi:DNA-directed RNA polymerase subunit N (RpoN/RPB10)